MYSNWAYDLTSTKASKKKSPNESSQQEWNRRMAAVNLVSTMRTESERDLSALSASEMVSAALVHD